jgi:hypothetical protein
VTDDSLWYKDAIIYEVHVESFFDSTNHGVGDFRGLTSKLDDLQDLPVRQRRGRCARDAPGPRGWAHITLAAFLDEANAGRQA